jgi:hypothetical protein
MMWQLILYAIVLLVALSIGDVIRAKPTFKSALKMALNRNVLVPMWFAPLFVSISLVIASSGYTELSKHSTSIDAITLLGGMSVTVEIIAMGVLAVWMWDILYSWRKKKQSQYFSWVEKIDKQGLWKYTDEEKKYIVKHNSEFKEKMRERFPFINKFYKKGV